VLRGIIERSRVSVTSKKEGYSERAVKGERETKMPGVFSQSSKTK
jgi:hypothetical protein